MLMLICYDVSTTTASGKRRLSKIAKICCNYGQRVQNSVFECSLDAAQLINVRAQLRATMNEKEDSLRIYRLGNKPGTAVEQYGIKSSYDPEGELFFSANHKLS